MYRKKVDRVALDTRIIEWLKMAAGADPLHGVRATYDILSTSQRAVLVRTAPNKIKFASDIRQLLEETDEWEAEWAGSLFELISNYNNEYCTTKKKLRA